jgi:alanine-glyoxylate transaminase/serine-glyoxylate transaminase/serine-pyruvate transaminase
MIYGLHEALSIIKEEGLQARYQRHLDTQKLLIDSLTSMGMKPVVNPEYRLPSLTTVYVPEGIDEAAVRRDLLAIHDI